MASTSSTSDPSSLMLETALSDLDAAIRLATPRSPSGPVSPSQAQLLAQAHTQRATLLYTASKDLREGKLDSQARGDFRFRISFPTRTLQQRCWRRLVQETSLWEEDTVMRLERQWWFTQTRMRKCVETL
jgi:hypothetical protein